MVRREKCPQCDKDVEVDKEIIIEDPYEITILLKSGHRRKEVVRE
jgi:glutaredoxin